MGAFVKALTVVVEIGVKSWCVGSVLNQGYGLNMEKLR